MLHVQSFHFNEQSPLPLPNIALHHLTRLKLISPIQILTHMYKCASANAQMFQCYLEIMQIMLKIIVLNLNIK